MQTGSRVHRPHPALQSFVSDYVTYRHRTAPGVHHGLPSGGLTLVLSFDDPVEVAWSHRPQERTRVWSLAAGLHTRAAHIHHDGRQHGIEVTLTPRGARALLGVPASELAHEVVDLSELLPDLPFGELAVASARERPRLLDAALLAVAARRGRRPMPAELELAWQRLRSSHGGVRVGDLADETGWSRRHLTERFGREFGVRPKEAARVLRFEHSRRLVGAGRPLADVAAASGYADQPHLTREWAALAGYPPTEYLRAELPFLQDGGPTRAAGSPA